MKSYPQIAQIYTDSVEENKDPDTYRVIGAAMEVHRQLGQGFLERVYQLALMEELNARGVDFRTEVELPVYYKGKQLECSYRADFVCMDEIIVELKAKDKLDGTDSAQIINYLKLANLKRGVLLNFGDKSLEFKRIVC